MTHELGPTSRALLAAARDGLGPDDATAARVRAKLAAALAGGLAVGAGATKAAATTHAVTGAATGTATATTTTGAATALATTAATTGLKLKLAIACLVAATGAGITTVATLATRTPARVDAPRLSSPAAAPLDDEPHASVRVTVAEAVPALAAPAAAAPARATAATDGVSLTREVELIDRAMARLRDGAYAAAVDAIATYERETAGRGQLAEDAAAIQIESRCRLHEDVAAALDAFDVRWPTSAQRARLTSTCSH